MEQFNIYLFGPPRLGTQGHVIPINRRKMLALLAYLLVTGQPHSREALAALFWPDFDTSSALANLRRDLSRLKDILGDGCLQIERDNVQVDPKAEIWVDACQFEALVRQAEEHGHFRPGEETSFTCEHCRGWLEEAAALYTDSFLAGFTLPDSSTFDEWQFFQTERFRTRVASVLTHLAHWHINQGDYEAAIKPARNWLALDQLHEPAHRMIMQLYAWTGQASAAMRQYHVLTGLLQKEIGGEPEAETTSLYEAVRARQVTPPELIPTSGPRALAADVMTPEISGSPGKAEKQYRPETFLSAPSTDTRLLDIPTQPTPLIGREDELTELGDLLMKPDTRLVTLAGPGGIGKTRLAIEAASRNAKAFPNGAVFVPLAPVGEAQIIIQAVASALRFRFSQGADLKEQLLRRISGLRMLLVLDNFEQLLPASGLLSEILAAAPNLRLLITSRERLNLVEEWVYEVRGLPFTTSGEPVQESGAVQLFLDRARRVNPHLSADEATIGEIMRICRLVEGMPLAIELAAAWARAMSTRDIADELEQGLDLLTSAPTSLRNLPDRHRSIRVIFDQSWESLTAGEQVVLARLSVFHNGCSREAAEQVAGARLSHLTALVDKALVRYNANRYEMHELIRQYALERLGENPQQQADTLNRHHRFYLDLLAQATPWLKGGRQIEASIKINADIDNVRSAWQRAIEQGDQISLARAAEAYWLFHEFSGFLTQGEAAFRLAAETIEPGKGDPVLCGFLRVAQGSLLARQWHFEQGRSLIEQGLKLLREADSQDLEKLSFSLIWLAFLRVLQGQFAEGVRLSKESLSFFPQTGDRWTRAEALRLVGAASLYQGHLQVAEEYLNQCVAVCKTIGELRIRTYATSNLGVIHLWYGEIDAARQYFDESLWISKSCNDRLARADALCEHGRLFIATGEYDLAVETARACVSIYKELGRDRISLANILLGKSLRLMGANGAEEALREGLEAAQFVGHRPDIAAGFEGLGALALDNGEYDLAEQYFRQSLAIWEEIGHEPEIGFLLCRSSSAMLGSNPPDYDHIQAQLIRALRLAKKHQVGTIAITALVGLEALRVLAGETRQAEMLMSYAHRHPATTLEVRRWIENFMRQAGIDGFSPSNDNAINRLSWQAVAERWESSFAERS